MYQLRDKDVSTPEEVQFAILENSGTLTVLKKEASKLKWKDPLISDGIVQQQVLQAIGKDEAWLREQLETEGISDPADVFLCLWQKNGFFVLKKTAQNPAEMQHGRHQHTAD